jgi:class 3 adenylate cyclase/tetratricopeptide (TPR) repeat protein
MTCPRCQAVNREDRRFCEDCGARLAAACAACGAEVTPGKKFCGSCGSAISAAPPQRRLDSPGAYIPKHLAEKILTSKIALEGERKRVTVLFADMKGSMELLADRDPEEARKILDPVLERMMEAVHYCEGTVNQVLGDGIMALFGAPIAQEDHALRACYASLRMQEAVTRYGDDARRSLGVPVTIRVGLNSGEVVVRAIGNDLHMDYTAIGVTTHLANRVEQIATPGSVLMTAHTLELVEGYVQVKPLGAVSVKGLDSPVDVWELTGVLPVRTRLQATAARGLTRFVGRRAEFDVLHETAGRARRGLGQVMALVGEAGVGKSRLFSEFVHVLRADGWLVLKASSVPYGKATAYLPVLDLLKAYFAIEDRDDASTVREKISGKLVKLHPALLPALSAILGLLDVPSDDPEWPALDPPQRRHRTVEAIKRLLLRESQVQPLCLVLEDLQGIDSETEALLDGLVESIPAARILLLVNYRPEYRNDWASKTYYTRLSVEPLPREIAHELLEALLGNDPGLDPLKHLLIERTEGTPFFLEESVRTLVETQVLVGERAAYRMARTLPSIQVPATVQAILAARIDRLSPEDKHLLRSASVIGKDVPFALLHSIVDLSDEELRAGLAHLQTAEFLYEASLFPDLEYSFKHALTHEVAYQTLLQEQRRALHARVVEAVEGLHSDRLAEQVDRLAHHSFRGQVWDKAVVYLRQAGAKAAARSANREAVAYFEQALAALGHLPEGHETLEQAIDLRFDLRSSLLPLGEFGRIFEYLQEAEKLTEALGDQRRLGRLTAYLTNYVSLMGDQTRALEYGERALALAKALDDFPLEVETKVRLGQIYNTQGDYRRAIDILTQSLSSLTHGLGQERFGLAVILSVICRNWLLRSLAEVGEFAQGIALGEEGVRMTEREGQPIDSVVASQGLGVVHLRQGAIPQAISALERGLELCRAWNIRVWFPLVASALGYSYALSGRAAEALPLLEQAVDQHVAAGRLGGHALRVAWLGEAHLLAGRLETAARVATRALDLSRAHAERGHEAWALWLSGEIASRRDPSDRETAEAYYRQGLHIADALAMRPLAARCHLGLGQIIRQGADQDAAKLHLSTATALLREMDMRRWLAPGTAESDAR